MAYENLEGLLTENEAKVYVALLKIGESTASPILKKTGLQNSVFYRTINRLMEKGFVKYVLKGKIKHFIASNPEILLVTLKEKERKTRELVKELKEIQQEVSNTEVEVFTGLKGVKAMYEHLELDAKPGDEHLFFGAEEYILKDTVAQVYIPLNIRLNSKGVKIMGLDNKKIRSEVKKINEKNNVKVRYTDFPLPTNMAMFHDKTAIVTWQNPPTGILIKNKIITDRYRRLFKKIWNQAKP